jgi:hypothetical protein
VAEDAGQPRTEAGGERTLMNDGLLFILLMLAVYVALMKWVLPRFKVGT